MSSGSISEYCFKAVLSGIERLSANLAITDRAALNRGVNCEKISCDYYCIIRSLLIRLMSAMQPARAAYLVQDGGAYETSEACKKNGTVYTAQVLACFDAETAYYNYQELANAPLARTSASRALYWLQCAAEAGHPQAQYYLGRELAIFDDSADLAIYWLQKAAKYGVGEAFAELNELDERGHYNAVTRTDRAKLYVEAANALEIAADAGDSAATVEYAVCCYHGYGVVQDKVKAFRLYAEHSEHENTRAMVKLGDCYMDGAGVGRNPYFAAQCYRRAAERGNYTGILKLLKCPDADLRDFKRGLTAFNRVKQAAELGDAEAQYYLGRHYAGGIGTKRDKQQAIEWFEEAALKNNTDAMCAAAELCLENGDAFRAAELLYNAANAGNAKAQRRLGDCYAGGFGMAYNWESAAKWYKIAAEQLDAPAMSKLADCYYYGTGVEQNTYKARVLLEQAAKTGDPGTLVYFAEFLISNAETDQDKIKAVGLLQNAADKGSQPAMFKLAECYENGVSVQISKQQADAIYAHLDKLNDSEMKVSIGIKMLQDKNAYQAMRAFELFKQAVKTRNAEGCYQAGLCYYHGAGVAKNINSAAETYKYAADLNHEAAAVTLAQLYATKQVEPNNPVYAFKLYCRTAEIAGWDVQFELAYCYENGIGTVKNIERANEIYALPTQVNRSKMHVEAGIKLLCNSDTKSKSEAFQHFMQAVKAKDAEGYYYTGQCYQNGIGVQKDISTAVEMYKQAITKNHYNAAVKLAQLYASKLAKPESAQYAVELYCKTAETAGNGVMYELAQCYENGIGTAKNPQQAAELYWKLIKSGHAEALNKLIAMHYNGVLGDPHSNEAIEVYMKGFEKQNADAICELAHCCYKNRLGDELVKQIASNLGFKLKTLANPRDYALGFAEPENDREAFYLFKLIENYNDPDVLCALGRCYRYGWGVEKDVVKAVECYVKAADAGSYEAMDRLSKCKSNNVDEQLKAAFEHFKQYAETGNANAKFAVAYCYYCGIGTASNSPLARYMCEAASNQYNSNMVVLLGYMYRNGYGVYANSVKAFELYKQAAEAGNKEAQFQLGWCYRNAIGVASNYNYAVLWYEKASAQKHALAVNNLGYCYLNGYGVYYDMSKGFYYYKQAAIAGNDVGQYNAGYCYENGEGVEQSYERAAYWYQKAADQGYSDAAEYLNNCRYYLHSAYNSQTTMPQAETIWIVGTNQQTVAFHLAKLAAERGNNKAFSCLGDCYLNGVGTKRDINAAVESYQRAESPPSQTFFNLIKCLETGEMKGKSEIDVISALKQANTALRKEINAFLSQMQ